MPLPALLVLALLAVVAGLWVGSTAGRALKPGEDGSRPSLGSRVRRALLARLLRHDRD